MVVNNAHGVNNTCVSDCNVTALVPKWLYWLLMCAPSQIGQQNYHSMLVPCHDTKPSFRIFMRVSDLQELKNQVPAEPWRPDVWISFPFLAWDLEIYPRTHMWFFNQLWCTGACACISNLNYAHKGDTFPLGTTSLLEGSSGLQEAYTKACPKSDCKFTTACWCHVMAPSQVSLFSCVFWIYRN